MKTTRLIFFVGFLVLFQWVPLSLQAIDNYPDATNYPQIMSYRAYEEKYYHTNNPYDDTSSPFTVNYSGSYYTYDSFSEYEVVHEITNQTDLFGTLETYYLTQYKTVHESWLSISAQNREHVVFPGHWLFNVGAEALSSFDTAGDMSYSTSCNNSTYGSVTGTNDCVQVDVSDASLFQEGDQVMVYRREAPGTDPDSDSQTGEIDWGDIGSGASQSDIDKTEELLVVMVDTTNNRVRLSRYSPGGSGILHAQAQTWTVNTSSDYQVIIAPHNKTWEYGVYNKYSWALNPCLNVSPEDPDTSRPATTAEFFADYLVDEVLANVDDPEGVQLDGGQWAFTSGTQKVDCDNDQVADYGYINGVNLYGLGTLEFLEHLRNNIDTAYGSYFIIQADSSLPQEGVRWFNTTDFDYLNGIEIENFPVVDDLYWYSQAFLHLRQWVEPDNLTVSQADAFSYLHSKDDTKKFTVGPRVNAVTDNSFFRITFATSQALGMPFSYAAETDSDDASDNTRHPAEGDLYIWQYYYGGTLLDWDWLGGIYYYMLSPFVHVPSPLTQVLDDLRNTNLASSASWEVNVISSASQYADYSNPSAPSLTTSGNTHTVEVFGVPRDSFVDSNNDVHPAVKAIRLKGCISGVFVSSVCQPTTSISSEYTVTFKASAQNDAETSNGGNTNLEKTPRVILVNLDPDTSGVKTTPQYIMVDDDEKTYTLSFKLYVNSSGQKVETSDSLNQVIFASGEQVGTYVIKDVEINVGGAERWVRYFDGGVALVNMTNETWMVGLDARTGPYRRIDLDSFDSANEDSTVDTGAYGLGVKQNKFVIPPMDALMVVNCEAFPEDPCHEGEGVGPVISDGLIVRLPGSFLIDRIFSWTVVNYDGQYETQGGIFNLTPEYRHMLLPIDPDSFGDGDPVLLNLPLSFPDPEDVGDYAYKALGDDLFVAILDKNTGDTTLAHFDEEGDLVGSAEVVENPLSSGEPAHVLLVESATSATPVLLISYSSYQYKVFELDTDLTVLSEKTIPLPSDDLDDSQNPIFAILKGGYYYLFSGTDLGSSSDLVVTKFDDGWDQVGTPTGLMDNGGGSGYASGGRFAVTHVGYDSDRDMWNIAYQKTATGGDQFSLALFDGSFDLIDDKQLGPVPEDPFYLVEDGDLSLFRLSKDEIGKEIFTIYSFETVIDD